MSLKLKVLFFTITTLFIFGCGSSIGGTYTMPSGAEYIGEMKNGKANGQGTQIKPDGRKYVGTFKKGKLHGQGTETRPYGS